MATLRICAIPDCGKPVKSLGWCNTHYLRFYRLGDPMASSNRKTGPKPKPLADRFLALVPDKPADSCWIWGSVKLPNGYGQFGIGCRTDQSWRMVLAHRVSHELFNGPIPDGMHVMHSCDNPSCVNPAHLRAGTRSENMQDSIAKDRHRHGSRRRSLTRKERFQAGHEPPIERVDDAGDRHD